MFLLKSQISKLQTRGRGVYKRKKVIYQGWQLDFFKFRKYLSDKYHVRKAFLFIGYIGQNHKLYERLIACGYDLVYKPTVKDDQGNPKGNVDAELVLHAAAVEYPKYQKAVIVSGDGDFHCLHKYLKLNRKLFKIIIPNRHSESSLLKEFQEYKVFLYREKENLQLDKKWEASHIDT